MIRLGWDSRGGQRGRPGTDPEPEPGNGDVQAKARADPSQYTPRCRAQDGRSKTAHRSRAGKEDQSQTSSGL